MRLFFIVSLLLLSTFSYSQTLAISGKIIDVAEKPVAFANITILKADNTVLRSTIADTLGRFSVEVPSNERLSIKFTAIGLKERMVTVDPLTSSSDLGNLKMEIDDKALKNVNILSMRPTIIQKADRMVVNVEGTAMAAGNTAYDVLSKAPGIFIDQEGNIQLNGRTGVTVMIDGRLTYLSARDLRTLLEGMPAENLKNLEIITNPSAKYDAEGVTGILNINLRKNTLRGMNGSIYSSYNHNFKQQGFSAGGNVNYKSNRWNSFLNLDMASRAGGREATFTRIFYSPTDTTYFDQAASGNFRVQGPPSVRIGTDFTLNERDVIGGMINYTTNTGKNDFLTDTYVGPNPVNPSQFIAADNYNRNVYRNLTGNVHYTSKLDTLGSNYSVDLDYVRITNKGEGNFYNYFTDLSTDQVTKDFLYTSIPNRYDIYAARTDFVLHSNNEQVWEFGAKGVHVVSDNDSRFYFNNGTLQLDPKRTNHFKYKETILAAYINTKGDLSKKLSYQAGLRAENTSSDGNLITTNVVNKRKYLDFFPSLFLQQKVNKNYGINYSYSRRLTRPNYGNLNPFRYYRDPYTWVEGNPFLRPQYTHSFSIAQVLKGVYNLTASYQLTKDMMAEIPILDVDETTTTYTTGNMDKGHSVAISAVGPVRITKKWDSQNTLLLSYSKYDLLSNNGPLTNDQVFFMAQSNHTILLPENFRFEVNLLFRGPAASGLYRMGSMHRVDLAVKKSVFKKKLDLTLNVTDVFKGFRFKWTTDINGNVNDFNQYFRIRAIALSLRYNFSKGQKVEAKRRNAVDEVQRVN